MNIRSQALLVILLLVAGCSSMGGESSGASGAGGTAASGTAARGSGFLGDYSQLRPAPDREGVMLYIDRSRDMRTYNKVMFDPVQVYATPGPDAAELSPAVRQRLNANMLASFRKALEPQYQVVNRPGPGVLRIRTALTGIETASPDKTAKDFMPIIAVYNLAVGKEVVEMTGEMEVLDTNGKRVAAATATRKGDEQLPQGEQVSWAQMSEISDYWALSLRARLDELRAPPAKAGY